MLRGKREGLGHRRLGAVEGGVEADDLADVPGISVASARIDAVQVVRLVQRRERHEGVERARRLSRSTRVGAL
jgi:hypothetical protein